MSDEQGGRKSLDDPETKARVVRALLVLSPLAFVGCFLFASTQTGRTRDALIVAGAALAMCLGAAGSIQLLGSRAKYVAMAIVALGALMRHR